MNHMRVVSTYTLRDNLSNYLESVAKTESPLIISRFGKPIAVISPYKKDKIREAKSYFGFLGKGISGKLFETKIRRSAKERKYVSRLRKRNVRSIR